ncbi:MAG TPA: S8 family serine peptidase, partial [Anaerolineae bacterium]|nr:S8 family serine peptidase [Anaerolineae bacterium]
MNRKAAVLNVLVVVALVMGFIPLPALAASSSTPMVASSSTLEDTVNVMQPNNPIDKIEPLVLEQITADGRTDFFVWMKEKADLSPAYKLKTKQERGRFVYMALRAVAERTQKEVRAYLDRQGVQYQPFYIANKILVRSSTQTLLMNLAARADVAKITANHKYQLPEPFMNPAPTHLLAVEPNLSFINADDVWGMGFTGQGTVMAGNDTGLDETHPTIAPHYRGCLNPPACTSWDHNYNWWDATGTYPIDPGDGHGHGTHTTGTMVGDDYAGNQIGVAPGAQTIHCKNMTDGGSGDDGTFTTCFQWDLAPWDLSGNNPRPDLAPDAINNSWGYWGGGAPQFEDEIIALQVAGIAVEVSAGNEGSSCATLRSPGDYARVLTTGSVNHSGGVLPGTLSGFSSRGPSSLYPGDYFPDVMAPGENIRSSLPGGGYGSWSGTSMAGPHTTALIGLLWSANPTLRGHVETTYQIIKDTAVPLTGQSGSNCGGDYVEGPNNDWGFGTIDALAAVQMALLMGGAGYLDGVVTDATSLLPIEGATVVAQHDAGYTWNVTTDSSGYYTLTVAAGVFTVTATHPHYVSAEVTGVVVVTDTTTTQDFSLTPRGLVYGFVTDADNGVPLAAVVTADDGTTVNTDPTTGYYQMWLDPGVYTVTATAQNYAPDSATVTIVSGATAQQDFALLAAVVFSPSPLHVTIPLGTYASVGATLTNRQPWDYAFEFKEQAGGFTPLGHPAVEHEPLPGIPAQVFTGAAPDGYEPQPAVAATQPSGVWQTRASAPFVSMDNVYVDYDDKGYLVGGHGANGQVGIYDVDADTWTTGATEPSPIQYPVDGCFGFNADGDPVVVLFNDTISSVTTLHRYNIATNAWDTPPVPADFPADGLWAHDIASVWRYSGENVCYISGGATTAGGGNTSALYAYYPDSNTVVNLGDFSYLPGGFDFHASWYVPWIGSEGGICVGGGVNSSNVVSADTQCYDIGDGVFNAVNADLGAMPAAVWGMADDILYEGGDYQLWIANGVDASFALWPNSAYYSHNDGQWYIGPAPSRAVYRVEGVNIAAGDGASFYVVGGSTGGFTPSNGHERNYSPDYPPVLGQDVPWFAQVPVSGVVSATNSILATMLFSATSDAGVYQPGDYDATLNVQGSPRVKVPVQMTVEAPPTWGKLAGTVTGLGACDANPAPLENAQVIVEGSLGTVVTLTTNAAGYYQVWLDEAETPLTVTVTYPNHEAGTATGVVIVAGATTIVDFDLRWLVPCLMVEAPLLEATLELGDSTTLPMTLTNTGAGAATFEISDRETGFVPALLAQGHGEWLYRAETGVPMQGNSDQATLAYPAAFRWTPDKPLLAVNILIYTDDPSHAPKYLDVALQAMGLSYTAHYDGDWGGFEADLIGGTWDAVFVANDNYGPPSSVLTALNNYVLGGGKLAYHSWTVGTDPGNALWTTLGFTFVGNDYDPPDPVYWWDAGHPLFNNPEAVPEFTVLNGGIYGTYGQQVEPLAGFEALAGYTTPGPDPNQAALILGNGGRTLFRAFMDAQNGADLDGDGRLDGVELWMNTVNGILNGFGGDALWLYENPFVGTVPPDGGQIPVDVTFDASVVGQPGEYLATLNVESNDPVNNRYTFPARMLVNVPPDYGKLEGVVNGLGYCDVNPAPLYKADVVIEGAGGVTYSLQTASDGSYSWWLKEGDYTVTASSADHITEIVSVTIIAQQTTVQDIALRWLGPCLSVAPASLEAALEMGANATLPLTLTNSGAGDAMFRLSESDRGWMPLLLTQPQAPGRAILAEEDKTTQAASSVSAWPAGGGPDPFGYTYLDSSEASGPTYEWIEIAPPAGGSGVSLNMYGIDDGHYWAIDLPFAFNFYGTDYTQLAVASNGTVYFENVYLGLNNAPIPGPNDYGVNTFIAPFWDDLYIMPGEVYYLFDGDRLIVEYYHVSGCCASPDYGTWEVILFANGNILFQYQDLNFGGGYDYGAGATVGIQGDTMTGLQYSYNAPALSDNLAICFAYPGQSPNCSGDVPWLNENPITGTVGADSEVVVDVTFDAGVPEVTQPGEYYATLNVRSDDPVQGRLGVPVTMTVSAPATWGKLEGTVSGLGYCDANPAPLEGATVFVEASDGMTWTLTTGADGRYVLWLDEAHSPVTVTVTAAEHESGAASGVVIVGQQTTTVDFGLRWLHPCVSVTPADLSAALELGQSTVLALTVTNNGAGVLDYELFEQDRGFTIASLVLPPLRLVEMPVTAGRPEEKIEAGLLTELAGNATAEFFVHLRKQADLSAAEMLPTKEAKGQYVYTALKWAAEQTQGELLATLRAAGAQPRSFFISNKILVRGNLALAQQLAAREDVARITANHAYQLPRPYKQQELGQVGGVEWNIAQIRADAVWTALGVTGAGIVVADADTGVSWTHTALQGHYRGWDGAVADHNYNWHDATGTYPLEPGDGHGHGTHTTGTMVGDDGAGNQIGVAPGAQWIACKNMTDGGGGNDGTFTDCFEWLLAPTDLNGNNPRPDLAPDVINNSWGYGGGGAAQFRDEVAALQAAGILVEVSAGNEGPGCSTLRSPGDYAEVLTTGATGGTLDTLSGFSSRGPSVLDGNYFPDIVAPGENIRSSVPWGGYEAWGGTSMAGPHTVGLVALLWAANPGLRGQIDLTTKLLEDTAVRLVGQSGSNCGGDYVNGPNNDWGYGRIDAYAAVDAALSMDVPWLSEAPVSGTVGADSAVVVAVTLDAGAVTQPGAYYASLRTRSNDSVRPNVETSVTMTVSAPATWGKLEGTVSGLGYCDANPAPL